MTNPYNQALWESAAKKRRTYLLKKTSKAAMMSVGAFVAVIFGAVPVSFVVLHVYQPDNVILLYFVCCAASILAGALTHRVARKLSSRSITAVFSAITILATAAACVFSDSYLNSWVAFAVVGLIGAWLFSSAAREAAALAYVPSVQEQMGALQDAGVRIEG